MSDISGFSKCNGVNNFYDTKKLEDKLQTLLQHDISSVSELERWLVEERLLFTKVEELITSHQINFYRDTKNTNNQNCICITKPISSHFLPNIMQSLIRNLAIVRSQNCWKMKNMVICVK